MFLGMLEAVGEVIDQPGSGEASRALDSALRYFAEAAPKHTADEEDSLFPRLRQLDHPEIQSAFATLEKLEDDHRCAMSLHDKVELLGAQYLSTGKLSDDEIAEFRRLVASLSLMYKEHIQAEEELIFPLAARVLSDTEKTAIGNEMASRRQVEACNQSVLDVTVRTWTRLCPHVT
jgi:hemerythrin-like domain-containing protein